MRDEKDVELKLICMDNVNSTPAEFFWYPYIVCNKLNLLQGDPGLGKTTLSLSIAAAASKGEGLTGDSKASSPINVIYQTAEDGLDDTIKPRLEAVQADCSKIFVIDESDIPLCMRDQRLEKAIAETKAKLVILDPIQAYLGEKVDFHRANEIRPVLSRLNSLAQKFSCTFLLVGHLNKNTGQNCAYRGLGSVDIYASVRSVLLLTKNPNDDDSRLLFHAKSNLAKPGETQSFKIGEGKIIWTGTLDLSVDQFMQDGGATVNKLKTAKAFLQEYLSTGEKACAEIYEAAEQEDFSQRTLKSAKKALNIKSEKRDDKWYWALP